MGFSVEISPSGISSPSVSHERSPPVKMYQNETDSTDVCGHHKHVRVEQQNCGPLYCGKRLLFGKYTEERERCPPCLNFRLSDVTSATSFSIGIRSSLVATSRNSTLTCFESVCWSRGEGQAASLDKLGVLPWASPKDTLRVILITS